MKILFAYKNNTEADNPFVKTLKNSLEKLGCNVHWGLDEFWENYENYDIIHINWPNSLFESWNPTKVELLFLEQTINKIKKRGIKILYTRHNKKPHYSNDRNILRCYDLIEKNADAIVHLGNYAVEDIKRELKCKHFIIPHHIYENIYNIDVKKLDARKRLRITSDKFVILTFGSYRNQEEIDMVLSAYNDLDIKNKYLLAPGLNKYFNLDANVNKIGRTWIKQNLTKLKLKTKNINAITSGFVSDNDLSLYFSAADVVLIQRKQILNSGNLPLAFYFRKTVIGPDVGNVGELLKETGNFAFDPNCKDTIINSIKKAEKINREEIGKKNHDLAIKNWNLEKTSKQYLDVYKTLYNTH